MRLAMTARLTRRAAQCRCWIRISGRPRLLPRSGRPRNSVEDMAYVEHPVPPGVLNPPHNPDPPR